MGKMSTGALCNFEVQRLEMRHLIFLGLKDGIDTLWTVSWTNDSSINVYCNTKGEMPYLELKYTITDRSGQKIVMDYRVEMYRKKSNLGKGVRFYFTCPICSKGASILYRAYGSHYFKHRDIYQNRIYYQKQMESKKWRDMDTTRLRNRIKILQEKRRQSHYNNELTKREKKIRELEIEIDKRLSLLDWSICKS